MSDWKPVDWIIFLLVLIIASVFVTLAYEGIARQEHLSTDKAKMLATIMTSILAIISIYVGSKLNNDKKNKDDK